MKQQTRRNFLSLAAMLASGISVFAFSSKAGKVKKQLTHHVYFWLKNPDSKEDLAKLLEGLQTLKKIETVRQIHIGVPASTELRDVVDSSFSASELLFFDNLKGQKIYPGSPYTFEVCRELFASLE